MDNKQKVIDFYINREKNKGKNIDENQDENIRVIKLCGNWNLEQTLNDNDVLQLVTVICKESKDLIINSQRLLIDIAKEAQKQLNEEWKSGRNKDFIEKLLKELEENENAFELDSVILREKVNGEPKNGSYYLQDGNHRMIASGIFFLRHKKFPKLSFHIGRSVDRVKFFNGK